MPAPSLNPINVASVPTTNATTFCKGNDAQPETLQQPCRERDTAIAKGLGRGFNDAPDEIVTEILSHLAPADLARVQEVSRRIQGCAGQKELPLLRLQVLHKARREATAMSWEYESTFSRITAIMGHHFAAVGEKIALRDAAAWIMYLVEGGAEHLTKNECFRLHLLGPCLNAAFACHSRSFISLSKEMAHWSEMRQLGHGLGKMAVGTLMEVPLHIFKSLSFLESMGEQSYHEYVHKKVCLVVSIKESLNESLGDLQHDFFSGFQHRHASMQSDSFLRSRLQVEDWTKFDLIGRCAPLADLFPPLTFPSGWKLEQAVENKFYAFVLSQSRTLSEISELCNNAESAAIKRGKHADAAWNRLLETQPFQLLQKDFCFLKRKAEYQAIFEQMGLPVSTAHVWMAA